MIEEKKQNKKEVNMLNNEYLRLFRHNFSEAEQRFLEKALMERRGEDLYVYDPHGELGITLDNRGGWCCLHEEYFSEVQEKE